jgi:hypothetical protein
MEREDSETLGWAVLAMCMKMGERVPMCGW